MPRNYNDDDESAFNDELINEDEDFSEDSNNEDDISDCSSYNNN